MNIWSRDIIPISTSATPELKAADKVVPEAFPVTKTDTVEQDSCPKASIEIIDGRIKVVSYNSAFIAKIKKQLGELSFGLSEEEVIRRYEERENVEKEDPWLDIKHLGIDDDGRIKVELDWNYSFIRHLADNGITAESEEEAIQKYLSLISHTAAANNVEVSSTGLDSFEELDEQTRIELEEAARQVAEQKEQLAKRRRRKK